MKWFFTFAILFAGASSLATGSSPEDTPPGAKIQYDSWCQGERVMTTDRDGQVYAAWDCSEISDYSRCVEHAEKRGAWTFVTATCDSGRHSYLHKPLFCESYEDYEDCPPSRPGPDDTDDGDGGRTGDDDYGGDF